jgi:hypothetical protein
MSVAGAAGGHIVVPLLLESLLLWTVRFSTIGGQFVSWRSLESIHRLPDIAAWPQPSDLKIYFIADGDKPRIPTEKTLSWHQVGTFQDQANPGQSVAAVSSLY